jgi:hypothetical protein
MSALHKPWPVTVRSGSGTGRYRHKATQEPWPRRPAAGVMAMTCDYVGTASIFLKLACELVTKAVQASARLAGSRPPCVIRVWITAERAGLIVHVWDASPGMPVLRQAAPDQERGPRPRPPHRETPRRPRRPVPLTQEPEPGHHLGHHQQQHPSRHQRTPGRPPPAPSTPNPYHRRTPRPRPFGGLQRDPIQRPRT